MYAFAALTTITDGCGKDSTVLECRCAAYALALSFCACNGKDDVKGV